MAVYNFTRLFLHEVMKFKVQNKYKVFQLFSECAGRFSATASFLLDEEARFF